MNSGKDICKSLKDIRRNIAKENGIEMDIPECTFKGACSGTCPRCEMEVRQLENELAKRLSLGKFATVAGIALTLAVPTTAVAHNQDTLAGVRMINRDLHPMASSVSVDRVADLERNPKGNYCFSAIILDKENEKPMPFVDVVVKKNGETVAWGQTDWDGRILIEGLDEGQYDLELACVGYERMIMKNVKAMTRKEKKMPTTLMMTPYAQTQGFIIIDEFLNPPIDHEAGGVIQNMEIEGVKVKAQY